jgi:hypothetical protein
MEYDCRICLETFHKRNELIAPCKCSGSGKYVCKSCLNKYLNVDKGTVRYTTCPSCKSLYKRNVSNIDVNTSLETNNEIIFGIGFLSFITPILILAGKNKTIMTIIVFIIYFISLTLVIDLLNEDSWGITVVILLFGFIMVASEKMAHIAYSTWLILLYGVLSYKTLDTVWNTVYTTKYNEIIRDMKCDMFDFDLNKYVNI